MQLSKQIESFLDKAHSDPRIGTTHIALYLSILNMWYQSSGRLYVYNRQVMRVAKISSSSTYSKLLRDLTEGGYVAFEPSYYKRTPSNLKIIDFASY
ncbi:hypothetical protein SAMN05216327_11249 [Dyadobacter sp. SG02]|nr:hypothetical protein SAMN05216327_11249 [Dyadobacter sp. SG02]